MGVLMRAGRLDQPIQIQAVTLVDDGMGSPMEEWAAVIGAPTWAEVMPLRGLERIEAAKVEASTTVKLRIRRFAGLTTKNRVLHGSKVYNIRAIEDYGRSGDMVLHGEEIE